MQTMQKKKVIRHSKHFLSLLLSHKHKRTIIGSYVVGFLKKKKLNHGFEMLLRAIRVLELSESHETSTPVEWELKNLN